MEMAMWLIFAAIIICQTGHIEAKCTNCPNECDNSGKCYECPENCENCTNSSSSGLHCGTCKSGYYGPQCNGTCPHHCQGRECNKDNRACSKECIVGFYGPECDRNCAHGCRDTNCKKGNGVCSNGCVDGYYGHKCDKECPIGCYYKECDRDSGMCSKGCVVGYHGRSCNVSCSKACLQGACHRLNGICIDVFSDVSIEECNGGKCHLCQNCTEETSSPHSDSMDAEITGVALGGSVLVAAAVVLILLVRRRRCQATTFSKGVSSDRKNDKGAIRNPTYNAAATGNDNTIACSESKPDVADHVYAVVQKNFQINQKRSFEMDKSVADGNDYDVTSTKRQHERLQRCTKIGAVLTGDNTYSHISHVNKAGRFVDGQHEGVENVYDHVALDFGCQGNEETYDVAKSNKEQRSTIGTEKLLTPNIQNNDDGRNNRDDMYNHTNQFARVTTDHSIYNTVNDMRMPRTREKL